MTSHAYRQAERAGTIDGPLQGHHREWYVVSPDSAEFAGSPRLKVGQPREQVLWFDRRSFDSEEELLLLLPGLGIPRIPSVLRLGSPGPVVLGFIEGDPLNRLAPAGSPVTAGVVDQIMELFGALGRVPAETVMQWEISTRRDGQLKDCAQFLQSLISFTHDEVYEARQPEFGELFAQLGIRGAAVAPDSQLMYEAAQLTPRPFCLVHGDLHRANFIVDDADRLWTIDWELATLGDPLYELATHLHLMRYPDRQRRDVTERWRTTMERSLPGAAAGLDSDLPRYLAYKRTQSVYTDVMRHAIKVRTCRTPEERARQLDESARAVRRVLTQAGTCPGLPPVPGFTQIKDAYRAYCAAR
ncbi:aminoglycoside phosphotransferase family protein [Streptomyces sp. WMMB 322]|uniref:aminoglycoside phosphotransferase family protein n=1 Tax=Streptomyces sp. WMMB 322 TaxID=1286821 RepID=UPI0006E31F9A|nr:aminoglycoside phosphotransferase family protein [Streptomyces sp. WMMB 322]SCK05291.1 Phosphotransferase enzyme family protein [Streptomyces sp. WMMB 322]